MITCINTILLRTFLAKKSIRKIQHKKSFKIINFKEDNIIKIIIVLYLIACINTILLHTFLAKKSIRKNVLCLVICINTVLLFTFLVKRSYFEQTEDYSNNIQSHGGNKQSKSQIVHLFYCSQWLI